MQKQIYRAIAIFVTFLGLTVAAVQAQTPSRVEVNIPFQFSAGKTTLNPGVYTVKRMSGNLVRLSTVDNKSSVIVNAPVNLTSTDPEATERLVFNKYGDEYFLAQIWLTADSGRQLLKEKKAQQPEPVVLSLHVSKHVE
jgi:hypothetical protein